MSKGKSPEPKAVDLPPDTLCRIIVEMKTDGQVFAQATSKNPWAVMNALGNAIGILSDQFNKKGKSPIEIAPANLVIPHG